MQIRRNGIVKTISLIICFIFMLNVNVKVSAENTIDVTGAYNLTVSIPVEYESIKNSGIEVKLYKVAEITNTLKYNALKEYKIMNDFNYSYISNNNETKEIKVRLNGVDANTTALEWEALTYAAESVAKKQLPTIVETFSNGKAVFSNLSSGLYLLQVDSISVNEKKYSFMPNLISIPTCNKEGTINQDDMHNLITELKVEMITDVITGHMVINKKMDVTPQMRLEGAIETESRPGEISTNHSEILGKLPKTGQMKWVIPAFAVMGFALVGVGIIMILRGKKVE